MYISATADEYKTILGKLIRKEVLFSNKVAEKGHINLTRKRKRSQYWVSVKIPKDEIDLEIKNGIPEESQRSTTSRCHCQYISCLYNMTIKEVGIGEWPL